VDRGEGVRRRHCHREPPPRPGIDAAGHLLRLATAGDGRRSPRRTVFHRPRTRAHLALSAVFLASHPPNWILGASAGAGRQFRGGAERGMGAGPGQLEKDRNRACAKIRWVVCALIGGAAAATVGPYLVFVLVACGVTGDRHPPAERAVVARLGPGVRPCHCPPWGFGRWSRGVGLGGNQGRRPFLRWWFVIIPLMQHDVVTTYHWMNGAQFLDAVALGQITPGPVVQTVAVVGYAAGEWAVDC